MYSDYIEIVKTVYRLSGGCRLTRGDHPVILLEEVDMRREDISPMFWMIMRTADEP